MPGITPSKFRGTPIAKVDRYSGTDTDYQTVVAWTVTTGKIGDLKEVSMVSNNYTKTHFRLVIAEVAQFADKTIQAPLSLPFPEGTWDLKPADVVVLEAKSSDGTSITVDGSITGAER